MGWAATAHHRDPKVFELMEEFLSINVDERYCAQRTAKLFYLWGHAFEFERDQNWDLLEQICEKLSGRDDIWYATNGEICDYAAAYRSLVFSADGHTIYNPTLFELWFDADRTLYCIHPGETLCILRDS